MIVWEYTPVLNALIKVTLTIAFGAIAGACGVLMNDFVGHAVRFVFYVALPCLVVKGIGIGVDFYREDFLWLYIVAFLLLRVIALMFSIAYALFVNLLKKRQVMGLGDVAVSWLALTWISTVIMGIPICTAVFKSPTKGQFYGLLAGISSFIFQLPLQLGFLESHALMKQETDSETLNENLEEKERESQVVVPVNDIGLIDGRNQAKVESVTPITSATVTPNTSDHGRRDADDQVPVIKSPSEGGPWWSFIGSKHIRSVEMWSDIIKRILRNPVLWGIFLGFVVSLSTLGRKLRPPTPASPNPEYNLWLGWVDATLGWFGMCVSPVSLFAMGIWMQKQGCRRLFAISPARTAFFMTLKLFVTPLIMVGLAKGLSLNDEAGRAAVLIASLPISLASFSLGRKYSIGEADLAANVAVGNILMLPTVLIWNIVMDKVGLFPIA